MTKNRKKTYKYSFAPGAIEAHYRPLTRFEHLARALLLACCMAMFMAALMRLGELLLAL